MASITAGGTASIPHLLTVVPVSRSSLDWHLWLTLESRGAFFLGTLSPLGLLRWALFLEAVLLPSLGRDAFLSVAVAEALGALLAEVVLLLDLEWGLGDVPSPLSLVGCLPTLVPCEAKVDRLPTVVPGAAAAGILPTLAPGGAVALGELLLGCCCLL